MKVALLVVETMLVWLAAPMVAAVGSVALVHQSHHNQVESTAEGFRLPAISIP
jgi:hypothetical protein